MINITKPEDAIAFKQQYAAWKAQRVWVELEKEKTRIHPDA